MKKKTIFFYFLVCFFCLTIFACENMATLFHGPKPEDPQIISTNVLQYWEDWPLLPSTGIVSTGNYRITINNNKAKDIEIDGTVTIYLPSGITLDVTGSNGTNPKKDGTTDNNESVSGGTGGKGASGGKAAIQLTNGHTLIIRGSGTLKATGGNGGNAGNGGDGAKVSGTKSGSGGGGGGGAGGGGAGIGTNGGDGGDGGNGGARLSSSGKGNNGIIGNNSKTVESAGTLYVLDKVTVMANGGIGGQKNTTKSKTGSYTASNNLFNPWVRGGGGGGGGGGNGADGKNIGHGGIGGGGGGGGGSGGIIFEIHTGGIIGAGGSGGKGADGNDGDKGGEGSPQDKTRIGFGGDAGQIWNGTPDNGTQWKATNTRVEDITNTDAPPVKEFTITYSPNAGSDSVTGMPDVPQTIYDGVTNYITHLIPSRTGYTFVHWNTSSDNTSVSYTPNHSFSNISSNITLYAIWEY